MKPSDVEKTAFSTINGRNDFFRLPFRVRNAPSIFYRALDDILKESIGKLCYVYTDDIIVFGGKMWKIILKVLKLSSKDWMNKI